MSLGHDAEFVILDKNDEAVSAHAFFPSKEHPEYTDFYKALGYHRDSFFRDGTSLEVNTPGGINCLGTLINATKQTLRRAQSKLPSGYRIEAASAYEVKEDLKLAPPDVLESGCSPVKNAYEGWQDKAVFMPPDSQQRCAGGHLHLGGYVPPARAPEPEKEKMCSFIARYLDLYLAVPMIYTGIEGKNGKIRRMVYGRAGEYRYQQYTWPTEPKPTGIEYRVLGPEWAKDAGLMGLTFKLARGIVHRAVRRCQGGKAMPGSKMVMEAAAAINEGDTKEIFESQVYQKRLAKVLQEEGLSIQIRTEHFKFMRENGEQLFRRMTLITDQAEGHTSWPECLARWGFK